jgi:osmotically inducible protein OsmC
MLLEKILYWAQVTATGGRDSRAVSSDGVLDLNLTTPRELGGAWRGTNPEQLFAAGYAACFLEAMKFVASRDGTSLPLGTAVEVSVGMGPIRRGFGMEVELKISLPGLARAEVDLLVEKAHTVCSYSNATRDNIPIRLVVRLSPLAVHCRGVTTIQ